MEIHSFLLKIHRFEFKAFVSGQLVCMIVQMHKILIPYFLALMVTPATIGLEGTLLVCSFLD
jgi:hypothetical protein